MKKIFLLAVVIFFSVLNLCAQNGFTAALTTTLGTENRCGVEMGYQYKELNFYAECSFGRYSGVNNQTYSTPSVRVGFDYCLYRLGKVGLTAGMFAGYTYFKGSMADYKYTRQKSAINADALTLGVRLGATADVGTRMFVKAALQLTSTDFDRLLGINGDYSHGTHGTFDIGLTAGFGVRF